MYNYVVQWETFRRLKDLRKHHIISWNIYQSEKACKPILEALGLQRTTVRTIIHKWRKIGTVAGGLRSGPPIEMTPGARPLIQEEKETQNCIEKNWLSNMAELKVRLSVKVKGSVPVTANAPLQLLPPRAAQPVIRGQLLFLMGDSNNYLPSVNGLIIQ